MSNRRRVISKIIALQLICLASLVSATSETDAFSIGNPFKAVGHVLGEVARGVGGIFGQGLAAFASPTIGAFGDQANQVVAEAVAKLDTMLAARLNQTDAILAKNLNDLDGRIGKRINDLDQILDQKIGAIDIVGTKLLQNTEDSFVSIVRYAAILALISAIVFVVSQAAMKRNVVGIFSSTTFVAAMITGVVGAVIVIVASAILTPPAGARIAKLDSDFQKAAMQSFRYAELNDAVLYSKQLTVIDPSSTGYAALQKIAEIQRDVLYRPTTLRSSAGANELLPRARRLLQFANDLTPSDRLSEFDQREVSATAAVVLWQLARTKEQEAEALCAAAHAVQLFGDSDASQASPFLWLSYGYLRWGQMLFQGSKLDVPCPSGKLQDLLQVTRKTIEKFDAETPPDSISHIVNFNRDAAAYYREAGRLYTSMIVADAEYQFRSEPAKQKHKEQRDKFAQQLLDAWNAFASRQKDSDAATSDVGLAAVGLPAALAERAQLILTTPAPASRTVSSPACAAIIASLATNTPASRAPYEKVAGTARRDPLYALAQIYPSAGIRNAICADQIAYDAQLQALEVALVPAFNTDSANEAIARQTVATGSEGVISSLVSCINERPLDPGFGRSGCSDDEVKQSGTQPFHEWLAKVPVSGETVRFAMVR